MVKNSILVAVFFAALGILGFYIWVDDGRPSQELDTQVESLVDSFYESVTLDDFAGARTVAEQLVALGEQRRQKKLQARGLMRLAFAEIYFGRWRNQWEEKLTTATEICGDEPSAALAELLMFRGQIKGTYQASPEEGLREIEEAIRMGHALQLDSMLPHAYGLAAEQLGYLDRMGLGLAEAFKGLEIAEFQSNSNAKLQLLYRITMFMSTLHQGEAVIPYARQLKELKPDSLPADAALFFAGVSGEYETRCRQALERMAVREASSPMDWSRRAGLHFRLARIADSQNRHGAALQQIDLAIERFEKANSSTMMKRAEASRAVFLARSGDLESASDQMEALLKTDGQSRPGQDSKGHQGPFTVDQLLELHKLLGNDKLLLRWSEIKSQQLADDRTRSIQEAQQAAAKFWETELRNRADEQDSEQRQLVVARQQKIVLSIVVVCFLLGFVATSRYLMLRHNEQRLARLVEERTASLVAAQQTAERASRSKGEFLARINHEIRNPLAVIVGYCELLTLQLPSEFESQIRGIRSSSEHLLSLAKEVLELTKIEEGAVAVELRPTCLADIASDIKDMFLESAEAKGLQLINYPPTASDCCVSCDESILRQILVNLVSNSIRETNVGFVSFSVQLQSVGTAEVIRIEVADSGVGLEKNNAFDVFEPFSSLSKSDKSFGLGLSIAKGLVQSMGGTIEFESEPGFGALFRVEVPVAHSRSLQAPAIESSPNRVAQGQQSQRVIVVDDQEFVRSAIDSMLIDMGYSSVACSSLAETIAEIQRQKPDCVLIDLRMPTHDGFEILEAIRSQFGELDIDCVAVTGDATEAVRQSCEAAGFNGFLAKPFQRQALADVVRNRTALKPPIE